VGAELRRYLAAAVAQGRLAGADVPALADAVGALRDETLIAWATCRDGSLAGTLRRNLEVLLGPYRRAAPGGGSAGVAGAEGGKR
jgi:hypothetical protein